MKSSPRLISSPAGEDSLQAAWQDLLAQVRDKPWLLRLLAERGPAVFFAQYPELPWLGRQHPPLAKSWSRLKQH